MYGVSEPNLLKNILRLASTSHPSFSAQGHVLKSMGFLMKLYLYPLILN